MKYLILTITLITGCAQSPKVGDCVRELGHSAIEKVIAKSDYGAIETQYINKVTNRISTEVYGKQQQEKLIKVKCQ